jgi:hypothetical protein
MTLLEEVSEILRNALAAYRKREITLEQYFYAIRIPMMDLILRDPEPKTPTKS